MVILKFEVFNPAASYQCSSLQLLKIILAAFTYKGCFIDSMDMDMGLSQVINGEDTYDMMEGVLISECFNNCKKKNFKFFGMSLGGICKCSDTYGIMGEDPEGCYFPCMKGTC